MSAQSAFEAIPIGLSLGTVEITLDEKKVREHSALVQWQADDLTDGLHFAPPGTTVEVHAKMKFATLTNMRAGIWAKSEHEFLKPMKVGTKVTIRGKVVDKYIKRGRCYTVTEFETVDETGELLMRSRETGIYVE